MKGIKILEMYLTHSKDMAKGELKSMVETLAKEDEKREEMKKKIYLKRMQLLKQIENRKDIQNNRERSEDIIKMRAKRLKDSIAQLEEREKRFNWIAAKKKKNDDKFVA